MPFGRPGYSHFLRLCAGRCGQIVNFSSRGNDSGVSHNTIKEWLSVLEASYIIFRLPPHFRNFSKRLIKSPKLYFYDTGLLCWLLGIREHNQVAVNLLRGSIFDNLIVSELIKERYAKGERSILHFWRDRSGLEIDVIIDTAQAMLPVEIKAGQMITQDYFSSLSKWASLAQVHQSFVVYGGD